MDRPIRPYSSTPVVGQQYCNPQTSHYIVCQRSGFGSHPSFDVANADDTPFLRVDASSFSWQKKHLFVDSRGQPVICLKRQRMSRPDTWEVLEGQSISTGRLLFTVTISSTNWFGSKDSLSVFLSDNLSETEPDFYIPSRRYTRDDFEVYRRNQRVAEVRYISSFRERIKGLRKLEMVVFPGYDSAFVTALTVIVEFLHREARRRQQNTMNSAAAGARAGGASAATGV